LVNEKVLITGGSGSIGKSLIPILLGLDYDVYCLERYVTGRYILGEKRPVKTVFGDIRDYSAIRSVIRDIKPEYVIHLAAISSVAYSYNHPNEVIDTNFLGTVNLAEACLREQPHFRQFLFAGSSEEYGNQDDFPIKENAELRPNSPYAVSKVASDKYLQFMRDAYGFPMTICRNFNTYGRKDNTLYVVEGTIVQMLNGKDIYLGDPKPIRDFSYIDDHVNSYSTCLGNEKAKGGCFNFCTGFGVSIEQLITYISKLTSFSGKIIWHSLPERPLDIRKVVGDNTKAKLVLDWKPKYTFEEGLKLTVDFWRTKLQEEKQDNFEKQ
jgi:dTDP-glucose 4,6-dehydratase